jgi:hypothetical protein
MVRTRGELESSLECFGCLTSRRRKLLNAPRFVKGRRDLGHQRGKLKARTAFLMDVCLLNEAQPHRFMLRWQTFTIDKNITSNGLMRQHSTELGDWLTNNGSVIF